MKQDLVDIIKVIESSGYTRDTMTKDYGRWIKHANSKTWFIWIYWEIDETGTIIKLGEQDEQDKKLSY